MPRDFEPVAVTVHRYLPRREPLLSPFGWLVLGLVAAAVFGTGLVLSVIGGLP